MFLSFSYDDDDDISVLQQKASLLNLFTSGRVLSFQSKPYQALTIKQTKSVKENYRKVKVRNHKLVFNNQNVDNDVAKEIQVKVLDKDSYGLKVLAQMLK